VKSVAAVAIAVTFFSASAGGGTARSSWDQCTPRKGDVRFRAVDGARLVGHRFGSGRVAVVLAHESRGWLCEWVPYAKQLAARGYTAFPFDFRGYGDSQTNPPSSIRKDLDVAAAVKTVRGFGAKKVFLVGASIGGSAVLRAAADVRPQVNGVVSVSGAADLVDALPAVKRLKVPVLFVAGRFDTIFAADARRLYAAAASKDKSIAIVARSDHGSVLVDAAPEVRSKISSFVRAH
jgi:pimeloyl-ACP methyl ester carboxylesterase